MDLANYRKYPMNHHHEDPGNGPQTSGHHHKRVDLPRTSPSSVPYNPTITAGTTCEDGVQEGATRADLLDKHPGHSEADDDEQTRSGWSDGIDLDVRDGERSTTATHGDRPPLRMIPQIRIVDARSGTEEDPAVTDEEGGSEGKAGTTLGSPSVTPCYRAFSSDATAIVFTTRTLELPISA